MLTDDERRRAPTRARKALAQNSCNDRSSRVADGRSREEFRTPSGVGKSPRNEPAVCRAGLMGI